jgi:metallo-beta-lactamase family protein
MASKATAITLTNPQEYDEEARALYEMHGNRLLAIPNLRFTATAQESRMINEMPGPKIIVSASGMADAGRILHHLKHNLWQENCSVIIAGYQAEGTMGRRLIEGSKQVKIMGEDIKVNAKIYNMKGFSAHADKEQLLEWYGKMKQPPKAFFVTHGEFDAASNFADELQRRLGTAAYIPQYGDSVTINGTEWNVTTSNIVTTVPEVAALREYLRQFESSYLQYRTKIEQIVARDGDKAAGIRKKMEKIRKYVDDMLSSL